MQCISHSTDVLTLLSYFLITLAMPVKTSSQPNTRFLGTMRVLVSKMGRFCKAIWNNRRLVPIHSPNSNDPQTTSSRFHHSASFAVKTLVELHNAVNPKYVAPISSYAAHALMYLWTYLGNQEASMPPIMPVHEIIFADVLKSTDFFREMMTSCPANFPQDIMQKLSVMLLSPQTVDLEAYAIASICMDILFALGPDGITRITDNALSHLISSSLVCCQRQMCMSEPMLANIVVQTLTEVVKVVIGFKPQHPVYNVRETAGYLNILAILSFSLIGSLEAAHDGRLEYTLELLRYQHEFAEDAIKHSYDEVTHLKTTGERIWHNTLNSLLAVETRGDLKLSGMKSRALRSWRAYGATFGWKSGVRAMNTVTPPSDPSDEPRYWKIPKHCFSNACACTSRPAAHRIRVCKGCYRVLYCGPKCQKADWNAGHRRICKTYYT